MSETTPANQASHATFSVGGMTCANCVARVERSLKAVPGVSDAAVNLATERASVTFDPAAANPAALVQAVQQAGYDARPETVEFGVTGMTCANCVARVERSLKAVPGVLSASVNLATERARVEFLAGDASSDALGAAVEEAGYGVVPLSGADQADAQQAAREEEARRARRSLSVAAAFTVPLFLLAMVVP
ncbi:MAG TPA: copper ion binding protein, partial [Deinococcales bacterium]|nr:copper ion binding protein [Deinococcales bacterium]